MLAISFGMIHYVQTNNRGVIMKTQDKIKRAFLLYEKLKSRADRFAENRGGNFGIAVSNDYNAKQWQKLEFRIHILRCYLLGEKINWFYARWLLCEEAQRRNQSIAAIAAARGTV